MNILFAGGGSGGHLFPGVAVAEELAARAPNSRAIFVGSDREIERRILVQNGLAHIALPVSPSSALFRHPFSSLVKNIRAYRSAGRVLDRLSPSVVVGLGGFASVPVVLAASRRRIPIVLLEQNAVLGRANHWLLRYAKRICLTYEQTPMPKRAERIALVTGNPVRRSILQAAVEKPSSAENVKSVLILGGSQGATAVNDGFIKALPRLQPELSAWQIIHQTGNCQELQIREHYNRLGIRAEVSAFFSEMGSIYQKADLVIARAGGTTLSELAVHGLPAVLIPYPGSIRDHQQENAERFEQAGGAIVLSQSPAAEQTAMELARCLKPLLTDSSQRETMRLGIRSLSRPDAADVVAEVILECSGLRRSISFGEYARHRTTKSVTL